MEVDQLKNRASSFLGLVFGFMILILAVSTVGFFYFSQPKLGTDNSEVNFWLYRNPNTIAGQENTLFVFIKNEDVRNLKSIEAVLNFPDGFILNSSTPECEKVLAQGCLWSFDEIKKGTLKEIELKGQFFGQANQPQFFTGYLSFRLEGFTSEFQKNLSSSVMLTPSLYVDWEMPEQGSFFDSIESVLTLENITTQTIPEAEVVIEVPKDFNIEDVMSDTEEQVEIQKDRHKIIWRISDLDLDDKKELRVKGYLTDITTDYAGFITQAGLIHNESFFLQIETEKRLALEKFDFSAFLQINKSIEDLQVYNWGDIVPVTIVYSNNSETAIKGLELQIKLHGDQYIDVNRISQNTWLYKQILSGHSGEIGFDLPIKSALEATKSNYSQAEITIYVLGTGEFANASKDWEIKSNKINLKVRTDLRLDASARYYDDERAVIGYGPLPPKVGQETRYWIFWHIKNTTNPIENISVSTHLPQGVAWTGTTETSHGLLLYDDSSREVTWQISELSTYQGGPYSLVEAGFEVSIIPKTSQLHLLLPLTGDIYMNVQDKFTGDQIFYTTTFLNTDLKDDPLGSSLGRVVE